MRFLAPVFIFGIISFWAIQLKDQFFYDGYNINDMAFHESLIPQLKASLARGDLGLDGWYDSCCLSFPLFRIYQNYPTFLVASLSKVFPSIPIPRLLHHVLVIGLLIQPLAAFLAMRLMNQSRKVALLSAMLILLVSSEVRFGNVLESYLTFGSGLFPQALAIPPLLIALSLSFRWIQSDKDFSRYFVSLSCGFFSGLTFCFEHLYGFMTLLIITIIFIFSLLMKKVRFFVFLKSILIFSFAFLLLTGYQVLSILNDLPLIHISDWENAPDGVFWLKSLMMLIRGPLLDDKRFPVIGILTLIGMAYSVAYRRWEIFIPFCLSLFGMFGRSTFGNTLDGVPGMSYLDMDRFTGVFHISSIFFASMSANALSEPWVTRIRKGRTAVPILISIGFFTGMSHIVFERLAYLKRNTQLMRFQKLSTRAIDYQLFSSVEDLKESGRLWTSGSQKFSSTKNPLRVGRTPYFLIAERLSFSQSNFRDHSIGLASELINHIDPKVEKDFERLGINHVFLKNSLIPPNFMKVRYRGHSASSFEIPNVKWFGSAWVCDVEVILKNQSLKGAMLEWWRENRSSKCSKIRIPYRIQSRWPESVPKPSNDTIRSTQVLSVLKTDDLFQARFFTDNTGQLGLLKFAFHPNWNITVNEKGVTPLWFPPGFVAFPLEKGQNHVVLRFSREILRIILFYVSLCFLMTYPIGCLVFRFKNMTKL